MRKKELFTDEDAGDLKEVECIIDALDQAQPIPAGCSIHSVGEALLSFLNTLAEPVVPFAMYQRFVNTDSYGEYKQLLLSLKTAHYNVFYYLVAFLRDSVLRISSESPPTSERVDQVASVFAEVILRAPHVEQQDNHKRAVQFIRSFLASPVLRIP
jgi:inositol polyphosphate 5-phosphatase INPP5B/F